MADVNIVDLNFDKIQTFTVKKLRDLLKENGESLSGNKSSLVSRLWNIILSKKNETKIQSENESRNAYDLSVLCNSSDYTELLGMAGSSWEKDMRLLPKMNFHQVYDYLVVLTKKYSSVTMKGTNYKKEQAFDMFSNGHVSNIEVSRNNDIYVVKSKVIASMKGKKYIVVVILDEDGDVKHAVCQCPAGKGLQARGHCNHVGALLFGIERFSENGYHSQQEPVSCTSRLSSWPVPRSVKVGSTPLSKLKIRKQLYGSKDSSRPTETTYDPRAPEDRCPDPHAMHQLHTDLQECLPASGFFLFHEGYEECVPNEKLDTNIMDLNVSDYVDVYSSPLPSNVSNKELEVDLDSDELLYKKCVNEYLTEQKISISDSTPVTSTEFEETLNFYIDSDKVDQDNILLLEEKTRDQSGNELWKKVRNVKLTASNFGECIKCKNPESKLKNMLYSSYYNSNMKYGHDNEEIARNAYIAHMSEIGNPVYVSKCGLMLSKERSGLGASLDGRVFDINSNSVGCLEIKCPPSCSGLTAEQASQRKSSCLKSIAGKVQLNERHNYFYQIQGQMYVTGYEWADFVVWFGPSSDIFVQRVYFNKSAWETNCLPKLDKFYKYALVPELLTRRIKRKVKLFPTGH